MNNNAEYVFFVNKKEKVKWWLKLFCRKRKTLAWWTQGYASYPTASSNEQNQDYHLEQFEQQWQSGTQTSWGTIRAQRSCGGSSKEVGQYQGTVCGFLQVWLNVLVFIFWKKSINDFSSHFNYNEWPMLDEVFCAFIQEAHDTFHFVIPSIEVMFLSYICCQNIAGLKLYVFRMCWCLTWRSCGNNTITTYFRSLCGRRARKSSRSWKLRILYVNHDMNWFVLIIICVIIAGLGQHQRKTSYVDCRLEVDRRLYSQESSP